VCLLLLVSITGTLLAGRQSELVGAHGAPIVHAYLPLLVVNWALLLYVCRLGRPRFAFAELAGLRAATPARVLGDVGLALLAASLLVAGETGWRFAFGNAENAATSALLPSTPVERVVWCAVAVSVGVAEEVVYRGYLASELARWTSSRAGGVLGQALLFALAHGEQGPSAMLRFFVYAVGLGALALARGSLVPGMLAHVGIDLVAGLSH
jgi:membrane protease YdiL (CAAX protease family)